MALALQPSPKTLSPRPQAPDRSPQRANQPSRYLHLAAAVKRAGLGTVEVGGEVVQRAPTFHDLRHSHASALIAQGWDIEEVSARLGHADIATTQRTYVHAFDAARRSDERRGRLDRLYGNAMETA